MAKAFAVANGFIRAELDADPAELLGSISWEKLLALKEVFENEKAVCRKLMAQVAWRGSSLSSAADRFECNQCSSTLLAPVDPTSAPPEITLICRACGHRIGFAEHAAELLEEAYRGDSFEAAKSGDGPPLYDCPECGAETYVTEDDRCANCGYETEHQECLICHAYLSPDEQELDGLCSYHADFARRDD